MYHAQFSNQRMLDHIIFLVLHRQLCETHSFHVTMHHAGRQRAVPSPSLEESILNILADRFESSTRAVAYHENLDVYRNPTHEMYLHKEENQTEE
ncbi:hypothetical protein TNCV_3475661 [Trichonephila clavipes]|nr:hypothetical protein TNCV_3475661 [Trichonephila clavipes]